MKLLTRDEFRTKALERDKRLCVVCQDQGADAHHIIERRLFNDGGYYIDNAATVCPACHIKAEETTLSCEEIREKAGITRVVLPEHLYDEYNYTKWGDIIQANGRRLKGELFYDESVQKILTQGNVLSLYDNYIKYPRTMHAPWSNPSKDDKIIKNLDSFIDKEVVVTLKMDGENFSGYKDFCHARSLEPLHGGDRGHAKAIWASMAHDIPDGWRFCAENLFARHSIHYDNLDSYLQVFSVWNERNECLSWDETMVWCELWGLKTVPVLYRGIWNESLIKSLPLDYTKDEGYVIRTIDQFNYGQFKNCVTKFVRPSHVTSSNHWRHQQIVPNGLK